MTLLKDPRLKHDTARTSEFVFPTLLYTCLHSVLLT